MNVSFDPGCLDLYPFLPTWGWSEHGFRQSPCHTASYSAQLDLEAFINNTVPCPPPRTLCRFWEVVQNSSLNSSYYEVVQAACGIPQRHVCNSVPVTGTPVLGGTDNNLVAIIVPVVIVLLVIIVIGAVFWWRTHKRCPELCTGVYVCCNRAIINKLRRSESRSPTLGDHKEKTDADVHNKDKHNNGYVNYGIRMDTNSVAAKYAVNESEEEESVLDNENNERLQENGDIKMYSSAPDLLPTPYIRNDTHRLSYC